MKSEETLKPKTTMNNEKYQRMLSCRQELVDAVRNFKIELYASESDLPFSDEQIRKLITCEVVEKDLVFSIKLPNAEFTYSHDNCQKTFYNEFSSCYRTLKDMCLFYPTLTANLLSLQEAYSNYLKALKKI